MRDGIALEKPNMADRHREFDMAHALGTDTREGDFHAATIADDAAMLDAFVLAATASPQSRTGLKIAFAEKTALFGLEGAVVDRLGVLNFPVRPGTNGIRRGHTDADVIELFGLFQAPAPLAGACAWRQTDIGGHRRSSNFSGTHTITCRLRSSRRETSECIDFAFLSSTH